MIGDLFLASTGRCRGFRRSGEFPRFLREFVRAYPQALQIPPRELLSSNLQACGWHPFERASLESVDARGEMQLASYDPSYDPTARAPGQHERTTVRRLRMRTLVALGVLAVATALLGRTFGLRNLRFLGSEIALLAGMFVILRYVLPLVERHDRGATGEEQVGGLLDEMAGEDWHVIHDASLGQGNVDHILIGPAGVFTVETKSHPGPVRVARVHGATLRQAQAQRKAIERVTRVRWSR